jgi:electron transfer flavoprotein alpha/beta subunit
MKILVPVKRVVDYNVKVRLKEKGAVTGVVAISPGVTQCQETPRVRTPKVAEPHKRSAGIKAPDVATRVDKLNTEAKVI